MISRVGRLLGLGVVLCGGALTTGAVAGGAVGGAVAAQTGATLTRGVGLGAATSARVEVELESGRLRVAGGSLAGAGEPMPLGQLLRGEFVAAGAGAEPAIDYAVEGGVGRLRLAQAAEGAAWPWADRADDWALYLNPTVPTDLRVEIGAGESDLALGGLTLTGLEVAHGAGETTLDFGGDWRTDLAGRVESGAGDLTLRLPREIGVRVDLRHGEGEVEADGFVEEDGVYVNEAHGAAPVTLDLAVDHGAGKVVLELVG